MEEAWLSPTHTSKALHGGTKPCAGLLKLIAHCLPAWESALSRTAPLPHPKPSNLPPSSALILCAPTAWHEEHPALELSLIHRSPPLAPATLTSSLFTSWENICTSLHQQVSHSHMQDPWQAEEPQLGDASLSTSLAAGKKCAPHGSVWRESAQWGSQLGWGLSTAHPKPCLMDRDPRLEQWLLETLFELVFYVSLT